MKKVLIIAAIILGLALVGAMGFYLVNLNRDLSQLKQKNEIARQKAEQDKVRIEKAKEEAKKEARKKAKEEAAKRAREQEKAEKLRKLTRAKEAPPVPKAIDKNRDTAPPAANSETGDKINQAKDYMRSRIRHNAGRTQSEHYQPVELPIMP